MTNEDQEARLKAIEDHIGLKTKGKTSKVRETHYFLFGNRKYKILTKVETVGDRDQWLSQ